MSDSGQKFFYLNLWTSDNIEGGCLKAGHVHWMELDDWDFSMHQQVDSGKKQGTPGATSALGTFGFSITHNGPSLFQLAASTKYHDKNTPCTFEAEVGGLQGGITGVFLQIIFKDWVMSSRHLSGDHAVKTEHIELVFGMVDLFYKPVVNGTLGPATSMAYDISKIAATSA